MWEKLLVRHFRLDPFPSTGDGAREHVILNSRHLECRVPHTAPIAVIRTEPNLRSNHMRHSPATSCQYCMGFLFQGRHAAYPFRGRNVLPMVIGRFERTFKNNERHILRCQLLASSAHRRTPLRPGGCSVILRVANVGAACEVDETVVR